MELPTIYSETEGVMMHAQFGCDVDA